jgi:DNA-binding NarL/FixJ family response regulator
MKISVLIADHSEAVRKAVVELLKIDPEIEVVAECESYGQTMEIAAKLRPQVIILDIHLSDEYSVTPVQIKSGLNGSHVLAISIWNDDGTKALAERIGAVMLLDKANLATSLISAIKHHASGSERMPQSE